MKITHVDLYEVEIPPKPPLVHYYPKIYDITLCRLRTDEGLEGWAEYQGKPARHAQAAQALVGQDPLLLDPFGQPDPLTCALLDIHGKAMGVPMSRFFGTRVRERVPVSYWSWHMTPKEVAAQAEEGARLGFTHHKIKGRPHDVVEMVRMMKAAAGPDYRIIVDPNTTFEYVHVAARLARELEEIGTVDVFEDPILKDNLDWYRLLREKTTIPQALHLGDPAGVLKTLKAECVDYLCLGGPALQVRQTAGMAAAANVPIWVQMGGSCLGVLTAYSLHLQSTLANATMPCDEHPFKRVDDVVTEGLVLEAGHFHVPTGPGLGIVVDMERVERYRVG
jgi:L-alanine-DL-glutamate epimerase-like enolase superfamily enzyme